MHRMLLSALVLAGLSACATTAGPRDGVDAPPRVVSPIGVAHGSEVHVQTDRLATRAEIEASPAAAYAALAQAYEALGIDATFRDDASLTLANSRFSVSRRFAGEPLSTFFSCGRTQGFTGDAADFYRLRVAIRSSVAATPEGSAVTSAVDATGHNPERSSSEAVPCRSTGMLERLIAAEVRNRVGG